MCKYVGPNACTEVFITLERIDKIRTCRLISVYCKEEPLVVLINSRCRKDLTDHPRHE